MKIKFILIFSLILSLEINGKSLRNLKYNNSPPDPPSRGDKNKFDYSNYSAISKNEDLSLKEVISTEADQSVIYITESGKTLTNLQVTKESGDSSNIENSEFYGVNAAILVQGGDLTVLNGIIKSKAKGGNLICATNSGKVTVSGGTLVSTAESSARGLHATFGGEINAINTNIFSKGVSCANLATDRGEGIVNCKGCILRTEGAGSPLIYSTGTITATQSTGTSTGSQMVVIEGKNTATIEEYSEFKCNGYGKMGEVDTCGVMIYQSMSGDAGEGTGTFNCKNSKMEILEESSVYTTAPMFFVTNTKAIINLESCTIKYGSNIFLNAAGNSQWGNSGSNGGSVTLNLNNQNIEGDLVVDGISSLEIVMVNSSIKGKINTAKSATKLSINLDAQSKITLTGESYYTSLINGDSTGNNIIKGSYSFTKY